MTSPQQVPQDANTDDEIDLLDLAVRVWQAKFLILTFGFVAAVFGLIYSFNTPPTYEANSLLQLEEKSNQLGLPEGLADLSGDSPRAVTEIEIIKSRLVVGRAVSRLNLDWRAAPLTAPALGQLIATQDIPLPDWDVLQPYMRPGDAIRLDLLDVPPDWLGQDIYLTARDTEQYDLELPNGEIVKGRVGETLINEERDFSVRVGHLSGDPGRIFVIRQLPDTAAIAHVRDGLGVSEQGRNSGILRLTYTAGDPETARQTLDAIAQAYLGQNADRSAAEAESSLEFVESQLPDARSAVQEAEAALNSFREKEQAIDLGSEGEALLTQIRSLESELLDIEGLEEELAERFTRSHPEYQRLLANKARLEERLASLREEVRGLPSTQREVLNLTRELELAQEVYAQLRTRAQELQVLRASNIGNVRVIDTARTAQNPIAPRKSLILALSVLIGLLAGTAVALTRSYLRNSIMGSEDLEQLGLPVFATLNHCEAASTSNKGKKRLPLVALEDPEHLFVEGLRSLRTGLHFGMLDADTHSIVLTSPAPGVGKSFLSANLAVVAAQAGQKVCLVDADMRRGQQRKYFGLDRRHAGLAQVLARDSALDAALAETPNENLSVLASGPFPPNPSELLMRQDLPDLLNTLDERFDLIIIDAPPVLAVTDPVVLGRAAGTTIGVARFNATHPQEFLAMKKTLETSGVKMAGAILNGYDPRIARGRHGGGKYGYAYNARYSYKSES